MELRNGKVAIIGAGSVGATLAYNLSLKGTVTDIALIDSNREKAEAEILDIKQGASLGKSLTIEATGYEGCSDSGHCHHHRRCPTEARESPAST